MAKKEKAIDISASIGKQLSDTYVKADSLPAILDERIIATLEDTAKLELAVDSSINALALITDPREKLRYCQSAMRAYSAVGGFEDRLSILLGAVFEEILDTVVANGLHGLWRLVDKENNPVDPSKGEKTDWESGEAYIRGAYPYLSVERIKQIKKSYSDARFLRKMIDERIEDGSLPAKARPVAETDVRHSLQAEAKIMDWASKEKAGKTVAMFGDTLPNGDPIMIEIGGITPQAAINARKFARRAALEVYLRAVEMNKIENGSKKTFKEKPAHNTFGAAKMALYKELGIDVPQRGQSAAKKATVETTGKAVDETKPEPVEQPPVWASAVIFDLRNKCKAFLEQFGYGEQERSSLPDSDPRKANYYDMLLGEDDRDRWQRIRTKADHKSVTGPSHDRIVNLATEFHVLGGQLQKSLDYFGPAHLVVTKGEEPRIVAPKPQATTEPSTEPQGEPKPATE